MNSFRRNECLRLVATQQETCNRRAAKVEPMKIPTHIGNRINKAKNAKATRWTTTIQRNFDTVEHNIFFTL